MGILSWFLATQIGRYTAGVLAALGAALYVFFKIYSSGKKSGAVTVESRARVRLEEAREIKHHVETDHARLSDPERRERLRRWAVD